MKPKAEYDQIYKEIDENDKQDLDSMDTARKYLVIVVYDIIDDKRRAKMSKFLNGFGFRVQRSCFECILDISLYTKLIKDIEKFIGNGDLLRVYRLTGGMEVKTWGDIGKIQEDDCIIV